MTPNAPHCTMCSEGHSSCPEMLPVPADDTHIREKVGREHGSHIRHVSHGRHLSDVAGCAHNVARQGAGRTPRGTARGSVEPGNRPAPFVRPKVYRRARR